MKYIFIVFPAILLALIGYHLGALAKGIVEGTITSTIAGGLGGAGCGWAVLGLLERIRGEK